MLYEQIQPGTMQIDWQLQYIAGLRKLKVAIAAHPVAVLITKSQIDAIKTSKKSL